VRSQLRQLFANLRTGFRFAALRSVDLADFHCTVDQLVLLMLLSFALAAPGHYLLADPPREFSVAGLRAVGFHFAVFLFAAYAVSRVVRRESAAVELSVIFLSTCPIMQLGSALYEWWIFSDLARSPLRVTCAVLAVSFLVWAYAMTYRAIRLVGERGQRNALLVFLLYLAIVIPPSYLPRERLWQTTEDFDDYEGSTQHRPRTVSWDEAEDILNLQANLLKQQQSALLPQRKGIVDVYFVGFAGWAEQNVFFTELTYAQHLFDDRFDTRGRSLLLVNNPETKQSLPVASVTNLEATLRDIGRRMNVEEDVLFLFLASHGDKNATLSVRNGALALKQLTPNLLASALEMSGIRWRVIVVDACYSGSFVPPLQNDRTMIMTSASAAHVSYGCSEEAEMTYFGRAFLRHGLSSKVSFADSFDEAASLIRRWEITNQSSASDPQISVGAAIRPKLEALEARLRESPPGLSASRPSAARRVE